MLNVISEVSQNALHANEYDIDGEELRLNAAVCFRGQLLSCFINFSGFFFQIVLQSFAYPDFALIFNNTQVCTDLFRDLRSCLLGDIKQSY